MRGKVDSSAAYGIHWTHLDLDHTLMVQHLLTSSVLFYLPSLPHSFALLAEFKKRKGHCNVPKRFSEDPRLGNFVNHQKEEYKKFRDGKPTAMTKERIEKLESIGFNWGGTKSQEQGYDDQWNAKYGELEAYKERRA